MFVLLANRVRLDGGSTENEDRKGKPHTFATSEKTMLICSRSSSLLLLCRIVHRMLLTHGAQHQHLQTYKQTNKQANKRERKNEGKSRGGKGFDWKGQKTLGARRGG